MIGRAMDRDIRPWLDLSDLADMGETASKIVQTVKKCTWKATPWKPSRPGGQEKEKKGNEPSCQIGNFTLGDD